MSEWSACLLFNLRIVGSILATAAIFTPFQSTKPRHLSIPTNTAFERLLSGRVVIVATLPAMVSRLDYRFVVQMRDLMP